MRCACYFFLFLGASMWAQVNPGRLPNDSLISNLNDKIRIASEEQNWSSLAQTHYRLGTLYAESYLNANAIESFNNAVAAYKNLEPDSLAIQLYNDIGQMYFSMNNYGKAQEYFTEALTLSQASKYRSGEGRALSLLGGTYEKLGDYLKALETQEESLDVYTGLDDEFGVAKVYENIGSIYEDLNEFDKAHSFFLKSYKMIQGSNTVEEADVLNNLGDVYRKQGNYEASLPYTRQSIELAKVLNNSHLMETGYKDLSKAFSLMGDFEMAYNYRVQSEELKEVILTHQNIKQLNVLQAVYESDKNQAEIDLLREKNKVSLGNQKLLLAILVSGIIILLLVSYLVSKRRNAKRKMLIYKERALQAELEQKQIQETVLRRDIKLKTSSLTKYSLNLSRKNKMLADLSLHLKNLSARKHIDFAKKMKELAQEIEFSLKQDNEWQEFNNLFSEIHPDFSKRLMNTAMDRLSSTEIKLAMLLRLNLSSKEIASIMHVTPDSVRVARHRLRKKLPIGPKKELVAYMLSL